MVPSAKLQAQRVALAYWAALALLRMFRALSLPSSRNIKIYLAFLKSPKAGCSLNFGSSMRTGVIQTVLVGQSGAARTHDKFVPH